jgi:hypothetical protein
VSVELLERQARQGDNVKVLVVVENQGDENLVYGDRLQDYGVAQANGYVGGFDEEDERDLSRGEPTVLRPGEQAQFPLAEVDTLTCGDRRPLPEGTYEVAAYFHIFEAEGEAVDGQAVQRATLEVRSP